MFKSSPCIYQMFIFWLRHLYLEIVLVFQVKGRCNYLRTEHVGGRLCFSYWIPKVPQASSYYLKHIRVAFTFAILLLFSSRWLAIFKALISSKNIIQSSLWGEKKISKAERDVTLCVTQLMIVRICCMTGSETKLCGRVGRSSCRKAKEKHRDFFAAKSFPCHTED